MGMIKSEREYVVSKNKVKELENFGKDTPSKGRFAKMAQLGVEAFSLQIKEEIKEYEDIKKGKIPKAFFNLENIGLLLIALRIKNGITQAELAQRLNVPPSQVSRDENNDYHGVSMITVKKVLAALGESLELKLKS